MDYYSAMKEGNPVIYDNMGRTDDHYGKWNNPGTDREVPHDFIHMGNVKKLIS
jgi:hypothetical protein